MLWQLTSSHFILILLTTLPRGKNWKSYRHRWSPMVCVQLNKAIFKWKASVQFPEVAVNLSSGSDHMEAFCVCDMIKKKHEVAKCSDFAVCLLTKWLSLRWNVVYRGQEESQECKLSVLRKWLLSPEGSLSLGSQFRGRDKIEVPWGGVTLSCWLQMDLHLLPINFTCAVCINKYTD